MLEGEREILSYEGTQGRVLEPLAAQAIGSLLEEPVRTRGLVVWRRHRCSETVESGCCASERASVRVMRVEPNDKERASSLCAEVRDSPRAVAE